MFLIELIQKVNKLQTSLVDYLDDTLKIQLIIIIKKMIYFLTQKYLLLKILTKTGNDKYEFIYPEASLKKMLLIRR